MLRRLGAEPVEVRKPEQLDGLDGLIVPGGESTAIRRLMRVYELEEPLAAFQGPLLGTCAGMILFDREHLGLLDVKVRRNGYGRQVASFEADVDLEGENEPVRGVFIRAPRVEEVGDGRGGRGSARRGARARPRGAHPRGVLPPRAHRRHADSRALSRAGAGGETCPGIASGRASSTRRAPPTRSAASSSPSSRGRSSSPRARAGPTRRGTPALPPPSRRRATPRCRRTTSSARSRAAPARRPTARSTRP